MLQEIEEISPTKRKLKINVPQDVIESESNSAYNELKVTAKIPGFRPGKVPRSILEKKFGKNVEAQIIEKLVPRFYMEAVKEAGIEPVSYPSIDEQVEIRQGEPLSFSVTVEIKPEIEDINFEGISLKEKKIEIDEEEVDKTIESMRESKALFSATEEPLQEDDMAVIDSEAFAGDQPVEELTYKEFPYILGSDSMPKEFTDALLGKKKGDSAEIRINFTDDHPNRTLAGKDILFKVTVTEAKNKKLPPVDDEFAKEFNCETVEDLRKWIRENLTKRRESQINLEHKQEILNELIKRHDFAVPESMVDGELKSLVEKSKEDAMRKGEQVRTDGELAKEMESTARENVKGVMLLQKIGKNEEVEVGDEDVDKAIEEIAIRNNMKPEEVKRLYAAREGSMDALKSRLFADKVLDYILEKSNIEKTS